MGYDIAHQYGGIRIPKENEVACLAVLKAELVKREYVFDADRKITGVRKVPALNPNVPTLGAALEFFGIGQEDEDGGWRMVEDNYRWSDQMDKVFDVLMRFAEDGQIITFTGEDDESWGYLARGGECLYVRCRRVWYVEGKPNDIVLED